MIEVAVRRRLGAFALDVAFTGPGDGVTMLFGPSGAGKSATLAAVGGTDPATAGRVAVNGQVLLDSVARVRLPPHQRRIGWVHQDARLFPHLPVAGNLRYGQTRATAPHRIGFEEVVDMLGIAPLLPRRVAELSGGERQRVALGRALLSQPDLLLLDEPLAALDAARGHEIIGFIARLRREVRLPMLYVTHNLAEVRALADHVVHIAAGRVTPAPPAPRPARMEVRIVAADPAGGWRAVDAAGAPVMLPALDARPGNRVTIAVEGD